VKRDDFPRDDAAQRNTSFVYDAFGRVTQTVFPQWLFSVPIAVFQLAVVPGVHWIN